jgi:hypothetical protein
MLGGRMSNQDEDEVEDELDALEQEVITRSKNIIFSLNVSAFASMRPLTTRDTGHRHAYHTAPTPLRANSRPPIRIEGERALETRSSAEGKRKG